MRQTRLQRRNGTFYYRQKVPADLLVHYAPRREFVLSLRTSDLKDARRAAFGKAHGLEQEFQRVRAGGFQNMPRAEAAEFLDAVAALPYEQASAADFRRHPHTISLPSIDDALIAKVCATYLRDSLNGDLEIRGSPVETNIARGGLDAAPTAAVATLAELRDMLAKGAISAGVHDHLRRSLERLGYRVESNAPGYRQLCGRFVETLIREADAVEARNAGQPVDVEQIAPIERTFVADADTPGLTVAALFNSWRQNGSPTKKTLDEYEAVAFDFEVFVTQRFKVTQAMSVLKRHVIAYRDYLTSEGLHYKTVTKRIGIVKTLYNSAVQDDRLATNPAHLVSVRKPKRPQKSRLPFETAELNRLFRSGVYAGRSPPTGCGDHAAYWVPLIALFTGMRIEEVCQLRVSDIRRAGKLGWYIAITIGENQTLKTASSQRVVPLHRELERLGLVSLCEQKRAEGQEWLFHDLPVDKYGRRSSRFSKNWSIHMRRAIEARNDDHSKSFHSFRHLFKHCARNSGIEEDIHDFLTGHGRTSEARKYGGSMYPEKPLFDAMRRFKVPGLDLSHLGRRNMSPRTHRKAA